MFPLRQQKRKALEWSFFEWWKTSVQGSPFKNYKFGGTVNSNQKLFCLRSFKLNYKKLRKVERLVVLIICLQLYEDSGFCSYMVLGNRLRHPDTPESRFESVQIVTSDSCLRFWICENRCTVVPQAKYFSSGKSISKTNIINIVKEGLSMTKRLTLKP